MLGQSIYPAFDALYHQYSDFVYRLSLQQFRQPSIAEDVVQDVFVLLLDKKPVFVSELHAKNWLLKVMNLIWKNYQRKRKKEIDIEEIEIAQEETSLHPELWEAIRRLPPMTQQVIYLFYVEGYEAKEIAFMVGKSTPAIHTLLSRARDQLKELLGKEDETHVK